MIKDDCLNIMKCENCSKRVRIEFQLVQRDALSPLFLNLCHHCLHECDECGQFCGMPKHHVVSRENCNFCEHRSCRHCGICVTCCCCGQTACEECIDKDDDHICYYLHHKIIHIRRKLGIQK
jgi:hypothetical protein